MSKKKDIKPQRTAAEAMEDSSSSSRGGGRSESGRSEEENQVAEVRRRIELQK
jgi:hypothetical protein